LLAPVRPGVGTDAAAGAHHARAKVWYRHVIGPEVGPQDRWWWHSEHDTSSDRTPVLPGRRYAAREAVLKIFDSGSIAAR
jgi:hypothetical protein